MPTLSAAVNRSTTGVRNLAHLLLLAGLAVLGWQAVSFGVAVPARKTNAPTAMLLAPDNALVLAASARAKLKGDPVGAARDAEAALKRDATSASAAGILGIVRAQQGDLRHSQALISYAMTVSRRDLPTLIWAIEAAVQRGDINQALQHYDVALRVSPTAPTLLFPILATAAEDRAIRQPLVQLLRKNPPWKNSFVDYLGTKAPDLAASHDVLIALYSARTPLPASPVNLLIQRLVEVDDDARAWSLYRSANPGASRLGVRNGDFSYAPDIPTAFDWRVEQGDGANAVIVPRAGGGALELEAGGDYGGIVARQLLLLSPGAYTIQVRGGAAEGASFGQSVAEVVCLPSRQKVVSVGLPNLPSSSTRAAVFRIPAQCSKQALELALYAGNAGSNVQGTLNNISISPSAGTGTLR